MTPNNIHTPFDWLNVEKIQEDSIGFCVDIGLKEYSLAISMPLEDAITALLVDRPEIPSLSSTKLPKINSAVLNDPHKLGKLMGEVSPWSLGDVTKEQFAEFKSKTQSMYDLGAYKTAYQTNTEPEFDIFNSCNYCIDPVDFHALQLLVRIDDFYSMLNSGAATENVLCELGLIYLFYAALNQVKSGLISNKLVEHVFNVKRQVSSLKGGVSNALKVEQELLYIKDVVFELVKDSKHVPWKSINYTVQETIDDALSLLNPDQPGIANGEEPQFKLSEARYMKVLKLLKAEHPKLFR